MKHVIQLLSCPLQCLKAKENKKHLPSEISAKLAPVQNSHLPLPPPPPPASSCHSCSTLFYSTCNPPATPPPVASVMSPTNTSPDTCELPPRDTFTARFHFILIHVHRHTIPGRLRGADTAMATAAREDESSSVCQRSTGQSAKKKKKLGKVCERNKERK